MKKLTIEEVQIQFAQAGWICRDAEYHGSQKPLNVQCPEGHETTITWNNFQRGQGCRVCAGNEKFTLEHVRKTFSEHGCELLSNHYDNSKQKLHYKCLCGSEAFITFADFNQGTRCKNCKSVKLSKLFATPEIEVIELCEVNGCKLIRLFNYKKHSRIEYECKCGNITEAYLTNFKRYPNCKKCGSQKISGEKCHMYDPDREAVALRHKFRKICNNMIHRFMKATGETKCKKSADLLGYTPQELQEHILNHSDYKSCVENGDWHVDHIFPVQAFLDHGIFDLKLVNALCNLRPLSGVENLKKADSYDKEKFRKCYRVHLHGEKIESNNACSLFGSSEPTY